MDKKPNTSETVQPIAAWKQRKNRREQLLRAIRAKAFAETIRSVIRAKIKADGETGAGDSEAA